MKATGGFFTNREAQEALIGKFSARTQANARAVVNYLVTHARWRDDAGGLKLERGELVIGREKTSAAIKVSVKTFRNVLQRLREVGFLTTSPAKKRAKRNRKKGATRNRNKGPPGMRGRATEGLIITIREYDTYCIPGQKPLSAGIEKGPPGIEKRGHSSKKLDSKEVLQDQKQRHVPVSADGHGKNGKAKATPPADRDLDAVTKCYQAQIGSARLTANARTKIKARLRTYSEKELKVAIAGFAGDTWWMEHNAQRGMAWFFANDDRIEQLIGLREVPKKPEREPVKTNGTKGTAAVDQPDRCLCGNCRCTDSPAVDNSLCKRCQTGACWKERLSSPQEAHTETIVGTRVSPHPRRLAVAVEFDKALKKRREAARKQPKSATSIALAALAGRSSTGVPTASGNLTVTPAGVSALAQKRAAKPFDHFVLAYSNWKSATICFSESSRASPEVLQNAGESSRAYSEVLQNVGELAAHFRSIRP